MKCRDKDISVRGLVLLWLILLMVLYVMAVTPRVNADEELRWSVQPSGCDQVANGSWYGYSVEYQAGSGRLQFNWWSGPDYGRFFLYPDQAPSRARITTISPRLYIEDGNGQFERTVHNESECDPPPDGAPGVRLNEGREPELIAVTIQTNPGIVRWSCGGPFEWLTPVTMELQYNEQTGQQEWTPMAVLPLDWDTVGNASMCTLDIPGVHWYIYGRELVNCVMFTGNLWTPECKALAAVEGAVSLH